MKIVLELLNWVVLNTPFGLEFLALEPQSFDFYHDNAFQSKLLICHQILFTRSGF